jgi:hypothetical protein
MVCVVSLDHVVVRMLWFAVVPSEPEPEPERESETQTYGVSDSGDEDDSASSLREELRPLRLMPLQQRAMTEGVDSDALEDAMESANPKQAVVRLILALQASLGASSTDAARQQQAAALSGLRLKELRARARAAGVSPSELDELADCDDPKAAVIELLLSRPGADAA